MGSKDFSLPRVVPCFPLLGLTPIGLFMGLSSTIIYTSELILCSTIGKYSLHSGQVAHHAGAYPGFCSMKRLEVFLLPPWMGC